MHQEKSKLEEMQSKIKTLEKLNTAEMVVVLTHAQQWEIEVSFLHPLFHHCVWALDKISSNALLFLNLVELGEKRTKFFREKKKRKGVFHLARTNCEFTWIYQIVSGKCIF